MTRTRVTVRHHATEGYGLTFQYNQRLVDAIRGRIAREHRRFDPATKTWWLSRAADLAALRWSTSAWTEFVDAGR